MAQDVVYSNNSIVDISRDSYTVDTGTVTRSGGVLTLGAESRCTFSKSFGEKGIEASKLKVQCDVDNSEAVSRYNNNVAVQLKIQYYEREYKDNDYVYKNGKWQTIELIPYSTNEVRGNYKEDIIDTEDLYIKQVKVIVRNNGTSDGVKLTKLNIFNTVTVDKEAIKDEVMTDTEIKDYIDDLIEERIMEGCFIRLLSTPDELETVQEGELCRCAWVS